MGVLVSAIVITLNEERNIARCLSSLGTVDEIVVVDACSTDRTVEIARQFTPNVHVRPWPGYVPQKAYAVEQARNEWVLWVDADEELSPELVSELAALTPGDAAGFEIPRRTMYLGRWIRHSGWWPEYVLRLFRKPVSRFDDKFVHERVRVDGPVRRLLNPLNHYSYPSLRLHVEKMNVYTDLAAQEMMRRGRHVSVASACIHGMAKFVGTYIIRLGFLDGRQGLILAVMASYYAFLKYAKAWELQNCDDQLNRCKRP